MVFGLVPLIVAWHLWRHSSSVGRGAVLSVLVAATVLSGLASALPLRSEGADTITVVMRPNQNVGALLQAVGSADAGVIWADPTGEVWVLRAPSGALSALSLYRHGAPLRQHDAGRRIVQ